MSGKITACLNDEVRWKWDLLSSLKNEMNMNHHQRKIHPALKFDISGLEPGKMYKMELHMKRTDTFLYRWRSNEWVSEQDHRRPNDVPKRVCHPLKVSSGREWMAEPLEFTNVRITKNLRTIEECDISLRHRRSYIPVLEVYGFDTDWKLVESIEVENTSFIATYKYENEAVRIVRNMLRSRGYSLQEIEETLKKEAPNSVIHRTQSASLGQSRIGTTASISSSTMINPSLFLPMLPNGLPNYVSPSLHGLSVPTATTSSQVPSTQLNTGALLASPTPVNLNLSQTLPSQNSHSTVHAQNSMLLPNSFTLFPFLSQTVPPVFPLPAFSPLTLPATVPFPLPTTAPVSLSNIVPFPSVLLPQFSAFNFPNLVDPNILFPPTMNSSNFVPPIPPHIQARTPQIPPQP